MKDFTMKRSDIFARIEENPIIAAVRRSEDLEDAVDSEVTAIFLLHADIFNIKDLVDRVKSAGKNVLVHLDFLDGLGRDQKALDYIHEVVKPDGIITTKSSHIKYAKDNGIFIIQRFFLLDSQSYDNTIKTVQSTSPDMMEVMPGIMPSVLRRIVKQVTVPVIAGGLIESKEEIMEILKAGALGVSTGKKELWSV